MKAIRIFLLILILIGIGLLITQKTWVPKLVDHILKQESASTPTTRSGKVDTGVEGIATIGPTCPVVRYPADEACADKPYQTKLIIRSTSSGQSSRVSVSTDIKGYFSAELAPGAYTISAESEAVMPRLSPVTFNVTPYSRTSLNLQFDSGIR